MELEKVFNSHLVSFKHMFLHLSLNSRVNFYNLESGVGKRYSVWFCTHLLISLGKPQILRLWYQNIETHLLQLWWDEIRWYMWNYLINFNGYSKNLNIGSSDGKESACNAGDLDSILEMPWRREWLSTPVFVPGEFHEQRSMMGYSP